MSVAPTSPHSARGAGGDASNHRRRPRGLRRARRHQRHHPGKTRPLLEAASTHQCWHDPERAPSMSNQALRALSRAGPGQTGSGDGTEDRRRARTIALDRSSGHAESAMPMHHVPNGVGMWGEVRRGRGRTDRRTRQMRAVIRIYDRSSSARCSSPLVMDPRCVRRVSPPPASESGWERRRTGRRGCHCA